jgi:excisionase family DNA binding protein
METTMMTEHEAAQKLGISVVTLRAWRCTRRVSLKYYKVGRAVRYRESDLEAFIQSVATGESAQ